MHLRSFIVVLMAAIVCSDIVIADDVIDRLMSGDPRIARAASEELMRSADTADPFDLMSASYGLFEIGEKDRAIYWFYAGQLRARYHPELRDDRTQVLTIFLYTIGEDINAYALQDVGRLAILLDEVLAWDKKTFESWLKAQAIHGKTRKQTKELREKARAGLAEFKKVILASKSDLEAQAKSTSEEFAKQQDNLSPTEKIKRKIEIANYLREYYSERSRKAAELSKRLSAEPIEVVIGSVHYKIPGVFLMPKDKMMSYKGWHNPPHWITFVASLPDLAAEPDYNWDRRFESEDVTLVTLSQEHANNDVYQFAQFIRSAPKSATKLYGLDAYEYDNRDRSKESPDLPTPSDDRKVYRVAAGTRANGDPFYMICDPEDTKAVEPLLCDLYFENVKKQYQLRAKIPIVHVASWRKIEARLSALIDSWRMPGQ